MMKKMLFMSLLLCGAMFLFGCGQGADENKTPEQIKQEVTSMSASDIEAVIAKYAKAIEAKAAELKKETEKLSNVPLTEQLGDEAKKIRANMADLTKSLDKLKANMEAYSDGLKAKK